MNTSIKGTISKVQNRSIVSSAIVTWPLAIKSLIFIAGQILLQMAAKKKKKKGAKSAKKVKAGVK
jgi:hypothetical protein